MHTKQVIVHTQKGNTRGGKFKIIQQTSTHSISLLTVISLIGSHQCLLIHTQFCTLVLLLCSCQKIKSQQ